MRHIDFRLTGCTTEPSFDLRRVSCFVGLTDAKHRRAPREKDGLPTYYVRLRGKCVAWTTDVETARRVADAAALWSNTHQRSGLNYTKEQAEEDLKLPHVRELVAFVAPLKATPKEQLRQQAIRIEELCAVIGRATRQINDLEGQMGTVMRHIRELQDQSARS